MPRLVPDQLEKADEAVVVRDFALRSLDMLGLELLAPPVAAEATTAEAFAIASPSPLSVPVAMLLLPEIPSLPALLLLLLAVSLLRPVDLVAICTEPISESISLQIPEVDSEIGILELEITEEVSPARPTLSLLVPVISVDHGAGLICFIFGPRKDCIRNSEALCGPSVSSSSSKGLDKYDKLESVDERRTAFICSRREARWFDDNEDVVVGPAVCGTGGRVAVRNGEEKALLLLLLAVEVSGTERETME